MTATLSARPRPLSALALLASVGLVLSACSSNGEDANQPPTAGQAWEKAHTQLSEAESLRVVSEADEVYVEFAGQTNEPNGMLTLRMGTEEEGLTMEVREVDGTGYINTVLPGVDEAAGWIEQDIPEAEAGMIGTIRDQIVEELPARDALNDADVERVETEFHGTQGYSYDVPEELRKTDNDAAATDPSDPAASLNVEEIESFIVDGEGSLIGIVTTGENEEGTEVTEEVRFSDWNAVEPFTAPTDDEPASN
ncbi:MAG: hypothetical protein Q4G34_02445 [Micrococcus sp.]|nr:hypothetical protein [Micrococcus sp.]